MKDVFFIISETFQKLLILLKKVFHILGHQEAAAAAEVDEVEVLLRRPRAKVQFRRSGIIEPRRMMNPPNQKTIESQLADLEVGPGVENPADRDRGIVAAEEEAAEADLVIAVAVQDREIDIGEDPVRDLVKEGRWRGGIELKRSAGLEKNEGKQKGNVKGNVKDNKVSFIHDLFDPVGSLQSPAGSDHYFRTFQNLAKQTNVS